ncbi:MAG: PilZ domain-containing protein [Deltaproteobacteria bacterium]|nr:PilZ domain-containing protein [Deltaproteobacteria bacterium]
MFSIKAIYKENRLHLLEPLNIKKKADIILTFLREEQKRESFPPGGKSNQIHATNIDDTVEVEEFTEDYYESVRKHKRFNAKGEICLVENGVKNVYSLNDYSSGGLSFISDQTFPKGKTLTASIRDPIDSKTDLLDFEFEVARIISYDDKFKIGCKFVDDVDEQLWHSLLGSNINHGNKAMEIDI